MVVVVVEAVLIVLVGGSFDGRLVLAVVKCLTYSDGEERIAEKKGRGGPRKVFIFSANVIFLWSY